MPQNKDDCQCPFCKQSFTPENGMSPEEHIARGIIKLYGAMQKEEMQYVLPCPRCGQEKMNTILKNNALSKFADIYICERCEKDEASREEANTTISICHWYIVYAMINSIVNEIIASETN